MTQYAPPMPAGSDEFIYDEPERLSVLAICSLVASLICFLPLTGVIGITLGVFALIGIGSSQGRTKGTGLAVAGVLIGLLTSAFWVAVLFGISQVVQQVPRIAGVMTPIQQGDFDAARSSFTTTIAPQVTDERFILFREAYEAELGEFLAVPAGGWDLMMRFIALGPAINTIQQNGGVASNNFFPLPAEFVNGDGAIAVVFDPNEDPSGDTILALTNVGVFTLDGDVFWLFDPSATPSPSSGTQPPMTPAEDGDVQPTPDGSADDPTEEPGG